MEDPVTGGIDSETLRKLGTNLSEISVDGQAVKERSVDELIKLDQYLAAKKAAAADAAGWGAVGVARAVPPDAAGVQ